MNITPCKSCKASIFFLRMESGALMPVDAEPASDGNVVIDGGIGRVLKGDLFEPPPQGERYMSHYATCPNAAKHRKKRKGLS